MLAQKMHISIEDGFKLVKRLLDVHVQQTENLKQGGDNHS